MTDDEGVHGLIVKEVDVSSELLNGWTTNFNRVIVTRIGNRVFIWGSIKDGVVTKNTGLFTLPVGFRPSITKFVPAFNHANPVVVRFARINTNGEVVVDNNYDWTAGKYYLNGNFNIDE